MPTDSDPPAYALVGKETDSHSYSAAHQTSQMWPASPSVPVSAADQQRGEGSTHGLFRHQQLFFYDWIPELLALLFSAACLVTIGVLLVLYHGHPVHSFPKGITLNAVVAGLTAAYEAALLYAVSSAIGQSKWNIFSAQPRRLRDFERIDEASKGALGALGALISIPWSITSLGAIITILGFLIDPFAQQLINIVASQITAKSDAVWTEIFTNFNITPTAPADIAPEIYFRTQLNSAFWSSPSFYDRQAHCPTGNCTFPPFMGLQWCAKTETIDVNRVTSNCTQGDNADMFSEIYQHQLSTGKTKTEYRKCAIFLDGEERPLTTFVQSLKIGSSAELSNGPSWYDPLAYMDHNQPWNITSSPVNFLNADYGWGLVQNATCGTWLDISCPPAVLSYGEFGFDFGQLTLKRLEQSVLTLCNTEFNVAVASG